MRRRRADEGDRAAGTALDDLVAQLEAGSTAAESRLTQLATSDGPLTEPADGADPDRVGGGAEPLGSADVLDRIAASAAAGSPYSLELLLGLIVDRSLSAPAISRVVSDRSAVEEIEQEVLVAVSRSIHRYRGDARFTTWLYAVARNVAVSHLRRLRPSTGLQPDDVLSEADRRRMSSLVAERDTVRDAIDSLPPNLRQAVVLRDLEGLSYAEIAERLDLEINTVRSRLSRGRALLAVRLP